MIYSAEFTLCPAIFYVLTDQFNLILVIWFCSRTPMKSSWYYSILFFLQFDIILALKAFPILILIAGIVKTFKVCRPNIVKLESKKTNISVLYTATDRSHYYLLSHKLLDGCRCSNIKHSIGMNNNIILDNLLDSDWLKTVPIKRLNLKM